MQLKSKWLGTGFTCVVALGVGLALSWTRLGLDLGFIPAEPRPQLLSDAAWGQPSTARAFASRFGNGNSEVELLQWLVANHFHIDRTQRLAVRMLRSLPCSEDIEITWSATGGTIHQSRAVIYEAGCSLGQLPHFQGGNVQVSGVT